MGLALVNVFALKSNCCACGFVLLFLLGCRLLHAQYPDYPSRETQQQHAWIKTLYQPQKVDSSIEAAVGNFVQKESLKFKWEVHPLLNQIPKDSLEINGLKDNPYQILNSAFKNHQYVPRFFVTSFKNPIGEYYSRNLFRVQKVDYFLPVAKSGERFPADAISNKPKPVFFEDDEWFLVYYCVPTGELRMLGGNAFLDELPPDALSWKDIFQSDLGAQIMGVSRMIQHGVYKCTFFSWYYFSEDTIRKKEYDDGQVRYYQLCENPADAITAGKSWLLRVAMPQNQNLPVVWEDVSLIYLSTNPNPNWVYERGFPCYQITWVSNKAPRALQDIQPRIEGISEEVFARLKKSRDWRPFLHVE